MKRVLLIEDHADFAANVWQFLERRGFQMDHAANGAMGLKMLTEAVFDVVILDLGLPSMDGLAVCKAARARGNQVPILALTARDQLSDKLLGFHAGVDDYVVKPVALPELEARLHALLRRGSATSAKLNFGPLSFDLITMTLVREARTILLTPKLGLLLSTLMKAAPAVVSHASLIDAVWEGGEADINALHSQISNLRGLIDRPFVCPVLQTVAGQGYALRDTAVLSARKNCVTDDT